MLSLVVLRVFIVLNGVKLLDFKSSKAEFYKLYSDLYYVMLCFKINVLYFINKFDQLIMQSSQKPLNFKELS